MAKFYIHRTYPAYVTDVLTVEADDEDAALEKEMQGDGCDLVGHSIGDQIDWAGDVSYEVFTGEPHNLPAVFCIPEPKGLTP